MNKKMLWTNDRMQYLFHKNIVEYDMVSASLSISRRFQLLDDDTIDHLLLLPKEQRVRKVGLIQKDNKDFSEKLSTGIREIRRKFMEENKLDESNVVSLHSDAIIFSSKHKIITNIEGVEFVKKGNWTSFIRYDKIEMFYNNNYIDYKGIPKDMLKQHTLGLNQYLKTIFDKIENYDDDILPYISKFQMSYIQDKLPEYFYISFGKLGDYKMENMKLLSYIANIVLMEVKSW